MRWSSAGFIKVGALTIVCAAGAFHEIVRQSCLTSLSNGDFWWHLRVGLGILATHALPRTGLFSQSANLTWMATSWLYDIAIAAAYKAFDLYAVLIAAILFRVMLATLTFSIAGGLRGSFWKAVCLSLVAQYLLASLQPVPVYLTVLALATELILLTRSRDAGKLHLLYWLPLLFLFWANVDTGFVFGVVTLLLFLISLAIQYWTKQGVVGFGGGQSPFSIKTAVSVTCAAICATFLTPYGQQPYGVFLWRAMSAANIYFPELQALRFRTPQDYVLMLLVMASFLTLGLRRSRDPFFLSLLVLSTLLAFRSQTNVWLAVLASIAVLSASPADSEEIFNSLSIRQLLLAGLGALLVLIAAGCVYLPRGHAAILAKLSKSYPVAAADYIRNGKLPQPLFNPLPWGGFLTWYLPEYPVAIDGRTDLYGTDFNIQYARTMNFDQHYSAFPPLSQAGTLILKKSSLMGQALPTVSGFKTVYSDDVAVVVVREGSMR